MISCAEAVRRLWEYLDEELEEGGRGRVDEHLTFCRRCCGEAEFAVELRGLLASAGRPDLPAPVEDRLVDFLENLEQENLQPGLLEEEQTP